jgi:hypothetical protein
VAAGPSRSEDTATAYTSLSLIRYAAASGAISAVPIGMHLPPAFARLASVTGLRLPARPHLRGTLATAIDLAAVASATDNNLVATPEAKKEPRIVATFSARTIWFFLW